MEGTDRKKEFLKADEKLSLVERKEKKKSDGMRQIKRER